MIPKAIMDLKANKLQQQYEMFDKFLYLQAALDLYRQYIMMSITASNSSEIPQYDDEPGPPLYVVPVSPFLL